jgi:hypothetical protein
MELVVTGAGGTGENGGVAPLATRDDTQGGALELIAKHAEAARRQQAGGTGVEVDSEPVGIQPLVIQ